MLGACCTAGWVCSALSRSLNCSRNFDCTCRGSDKPSSCQPITTRAQLQTARKHFFELASVLQSASPIPLTHFPSQPPDLEGFEGFQPKSYFCDTAPLGLAPRSPSRRAARASKAQSDHFSKFPRLRASSGPNYTLFVGVDRPLEASRGRSGYG